MLEKQTIAISKKNKIALIQMGRKNQTFDSILTDVLERSGFEFKEEAKNK